jgi:hypothetical protein
MTIPILAEMRDPLIDAMPPRRASDRIDIVAVFAGEPHDDRKVAAAAFRAGDMTRCSFSPFRAVSIT